MQIVSVIATIAYYFLVVFVIAMWVRFIVDLIRSLRPGWRPRGFWLVILTAVLAFTDPPLKLTRRVIKPVRFGAMQVDFAWTIVLLVAVVLMYVVGSF